MPVNSFDDYPLSWKPDKTKITFPFYSSLASLLEAAIISGEISEQTLLPPQRELADYLDLSLSTVTKAYKVCERKGLIFGTTGKGTYVASGFSQKTIFSTFSNHMINMGPVHPFYNTTKLIAQVSHDILQSSNSENLFTYTDLDWLTTHRQSACKWLSLFHINAHPDNILITSGGQNALAISLLGCFNAGDKIATDPYTYPNFIALANMMHIQLIPILGDENGMLPGCLEQACKNTSINGIYLMPACSNPTTITMSLNRQKEIAHIIDRYGLTLIEDATFSYLQDPISSPLTNLVTHSFIYINSLSKALCGGLRIAYMTFSNHLKQNLEAAASNLNLLTPPLNIEIATQLIEKHYYHKLISAQRKQAIKCTNIYDSIFPDAKPASAPARLYAWYPLPSGYSNHDFEMLCREHGVIIYGSDRFSVGTPNTLQAIRIALSTPINTSELVLGLNTIKNILS